MNVMTKVTKPEDVGALIRQRRKMAGLTLQQAAGLAGVGVRFLSELERGKRTIQFGMAIDILQLFGFEIFVRAKGQPS
jgi:transcriptional regulator with XRE-family HTH domain